MSPLSPTMASKSKPSSSSSFSMGQQHQACAACKYQRRKCSKECPLAPFFPAEKSDKFLMAHKLYGVRNMMQILKQVKEKFKNDAIKSVVFESEMRARFPVHGCLGIIIDLQGQLERAIQDRQELRSNIEAFKALRAHEFHLEQEQVQVQVQEQEQDQGTGFRGYEGLYFDSYEEQNPNSYNYFTRDIEQQCFFEYSNQQEIDFSDKPFAVLGNQSSLESSPESIVVDGRGNVGSVPSIYFNLGEEQVNERIDDRRQS